MAEPKPKARRMAKEKDVPTVSPKTGAATGATASSAVESAKVETDPAATGADEAMPLLLQASEAPQIEACADVAAAAPNGMKWSMTSLLEMDSVQSQAEFIQNWSTEVKARVDSALLKYLQAHRDSVPMDIPASVMAIPPLAISDAAAGASLSAFREVMNYNNLHSSFRHTAQYEAAGTIWMLDPCGPSVFDESVTAGKIEAARWQWSEDVFVQSATNPEQRRFSFDVPLPARMIKAEMAQRKDPNSPGVVMSAPLPMIAGRAHVLAWYSAVSDALLGENTNHKRVIRLFEAALSVPIRLRLCPDEDGCALASLQYAEAAGMHAAASGADSFWVFAERVGRLSAVKLATKENMSGTRLATKMRSLGITFKGKSIAEGCAKALKALLPFVYHAGCKHAHSLAEAVCPELKDMTLLMRMAHLCTKRASGGGPSATGGPDHANSCMAFLIDSFRVARLTGEFPKDDSVTVSKILGQEKKTPGWANILFKKQDLVGFLMHEADLLDRSMAQHVQMFVTPAAVVKHFSATGEDGLVDQHLKAASGATGGSLNECFAVKVAEYRDAQVNVFKVQMLLDLIWGTWAGVYEEDFEQLATQECVSGSGAFLWHRHLSDSSAELGLKYRAFLAACSVGPVAVASAASGASAVAVAGVGASELGESDQKEFKRVQELLLSMRRQSVNFIAMPIVGGASGAEYSTAQLNKAWERMRLGHMFSRKKGDRRGLILSADLFPPNLTKHGKLGGLVEQIAVDTERMKRTISFMLQKRGKDDVVMLFDGRSRHCRKVMEQFEDDLTASGACGVTEVWFVYVQPSKTKDPRAPGRSVSFASNNKEAALFSWPARNKTKAKVIHRCEFNTCGEVSTSSTTYTGIPMRRLGELPRMEYETKSSILGSSASGGASGKRLQADIEEKGHPFSWAEAKPLQLWQRMCEHHGLTHIVDFTPGSAALAVAASGAMQYEGIAISEEHQKWMDSVLDRCIMYMVGQDKNVAAKLGGDADFTAKVEKFFAGTMQEARRFLEPTDEDNDSSDSSGEEV